MAHPPVIKDCNGNGKRVDSNGSATVVCIRRPFCNRSMQHPHTARSVKKQAPNFHGTPPSKAAMRAARMHEYRKPLVLEDVPRPEIKPDEILVKVTAAGMCRTDVQLVDGYFQKYSHMALPATLGHEIAGVVQKIGTAV